MDRQTDHYMASTTLGGDDLIKQTNKIYFKVTGWEPQNWLPPITVKDVVLSTVSSKFELLS